MTRVRVLGVVVVLACALAAFTASPTLAAKGNGGGGGGKGHPGGTGTATLVLTPDLAASNSIVQVSGCGYAVGVPTEIGITSPVAAMVGTIPVDTQGCIATSIGVTVAGNYLVQIKQNRGGSWIVIASSTLNVI
jgi:hypothetical protein